jgi:hypothetical protein
MIKEARLTPGPGFRPARALLYFGMRLVPQVSLRRAVAATCAGVARVVRPKASASLGELDAEFLEDLRNEGITCIPPVLTDAQLDDVRAYLLPRELQAPNGERFDLPHVPANVCMGSYSLDTIVECPHLLEIANRSDVLAFVERYLGCPPIISAMRIDCAFPFEGRAADVQHFHRDYDEWRFCKLFVYLTDVHDEEGPHEFVRRSHRRSGRLRAQFFSLDRIRRDYGLHAIARICGKRGTSFFADTWGIHRGAPPRRGVRMLFQVTYSILPTYKFEYEPVRTPRAARFDRRVNALLMTT